MRGRSRPFAVLAAALLAWLVVPTAVKTFTRASFFELTAPVALAASHVRDLQEYWSLQLHSKRDLIEAGRDLARVTGSYDLAAQRTNELEAEVTRLEGLLHMPARPGYREEPARVTLRELNGWWQRLVIRKGRDYGIPVGAPVVFAGGVVGRVAEVHASTSVVELITSPGVRLSAFIDGDTRPLSYEGGDNPTFGEPQGVVDFLPLDLYASAESPKKIVTSGLGGVFPAGLAIGELIRVEPSADGMFRTGVVRLDPRLAELEEVTVLVPAPEPKIATP